MKYIVEDSLFQTIDIVNDALFYNEEIPVQEKQEIAKFISDRQGEPLSYAESFAPTENDMQHDLFLFTGERITTSAGRRYMIGGEASRILRLMDEKGDAITAALTRADEGLYKMIDLSRKDPRYTEGTYCCKRCSCTLWLNMSSGGLSKEAAMLPMGIDFIKRNRDGKGGWNGFPTNYLLYVLNELDPDLSTEELKYAGPAIERKLNRKKNAFGKYDIRRKALYERILDKINSN